MAIAGVAHIGLCVTNVEAAVDFYCGLLGFTKVRETQTSSSEVARLLELDEVNVSLTFIEMDEVRIELIKFDTPPALGGGKRSFNIAGYTHLSLKVTDFDAEVERLRRAGAAVLDQTVGQRQSSNARFAFVLDPEGNRVELFGAIDESSRKPWEITS